MRLLWLTENYPPQKGGMAQSADRIVANLRNMNLTIDVLHLTNQGQHWQEEEVVGGKLITFPIHDDMPHSLNLLWLFLSNKASNYTYLVAFGGFVPIFVAPTLSAWAKLPLITLLRGNDFDVAVFSPKRLDMLARCLLASEKICCVSSDKVIKTKSLYPHKEVCFTPNGIDKQTWYAFPSDKEKAKHILKHKVGDIVIGLFGQLKAKKGLHFFLDSIKFAGLSTESKEAFHLLIVGEIEANTAEKLEQEADYFSYTHIPFVERYDLLPYYLACDIVAIPSFYDGMPNVLLEAGALGLPLIASHTAGMADVLSHQTAFLFEPYNFDDCRRAIFQLSQTSKGKLKQMGRLLQKHIHTNFTHEQEAKRYYDLLHD